MREPRDIASLLWGLALLACTGVLVGRATGHPVPISTLMVAGSVLLIVLGLLGGLLAHRRR
ncbi:hypothetical protein GCM10027030_03810 [Luteococcus sediminum]